jgi:hypothetical protein
MADDKEVLIGKWTVWVMNWVWEYEFFPNGTATWRDTRSQEKGDGKWSLSPEWVNLSWFGSVTKESWKRPLRTERAESNKRTWYSSSYFTGGYQIEKKAAVSPAPPSGVPVNPQIANVAWDKYVDQYVDCKYDLNYKIPSNVSFGYSSILQLTYGDGVSIELDFSELEDRSMSSEAARDAMAQGYLGRAGRIFPKVLAPATVPRLWSAKAKALADQDADFKAFADVAMTGVAFTLSVPALPAGAPPPAGVTVRKTRVPGVPRTPAAPLRAIQGKDVSEQVIREAMKDAPLKSQQKGGISLPKVQEFVDKLNAGEAPPAIKVDKGIIVEGNHRYIAGRITGKSPPVQEWAGGRPERVVPWEQMPVSPNKW